MLWLSNYDLDPIALRCRRPQALAGCSHVHADESKTPVLENEVLGAAYAIATSFAVCGATPNHSVQESAIGALYPWKDTDRLPVRKGPAVQRKLMSFALRPEGCQSLQTGVVLDDCIQVDYRPQARCGASPAPVGASLPPLRVPKVAEPSRQSAEELDKLSFEEERKARIGRVAHDKAVAESEALWNKRAGAKDWSSVVANLDVYKFSGQQVTEDPRRSEDYRSKVVEELGFGDKSERTDMPKADRKAVADVLREKAAAFWLEGTPRTVLRHLMHDTIPTGPPVRTPPHNLQGDEAQWVDEQLQKEVESGQLERGNSEWASPPFATQEFAARKQQRKRRVVVDY